MLIKCIHLHISILSVDTTTSYLSHKVLWGRCLYTCTHTHTYIDIYLYICYSVGLLPCQSVSQSVITWWHTLRPCANFVIEFRHKSFRFNTFFAPGIVLLLLYVSQLPGALKLWSFGPCTESYQTRAYCVF